MRISFIPIYDAQSMCQGYNQAIAQSTAKYKVYLHQDTFIICPTFIKDLLSIFQDASVGLVGTIGALCLHHTGVWWDSTYKYGRVIYSSGDGRWREYYFENQEASLDGFIDAAVVDGLLMATQYDIPWQETYFKWHFYDVSQCFEFHKAGRRVCIPSLDAPWCIHHSGLASLVGYNDARDVFLGLYSSIMEKHRIVFHNEFGQKKLNYRPSYIPVPRPGNRRSLAYVEYRILKLIQSIFQKIDPLGKGWSVRKNDIY